MSGTYRRPWFGALTLTAFSVRVSSGAENLELTQEIGILKKKPQPRDEHRERYWYRRPWRSPGVAVTDGRGRGMCVHSFQAFTQPSLRPIRLLISPSSLPRIRYHRRRRRGRWADERTTEPKAANLPKCTIHMLAAYVLPCFYYLAACLLTF